MKKIAVIGSGCWGTTLSILLANNGNEVVLWCRRKEIADELNKSRENKQYLSKVLLPKSIKATSSLSDAVLDSEIFVLAIPSQFFRDTVSQLKPFYKNQIVLSATKGLEHSTFGRMSQIIEQELKTKKVVVLSGPNHSEEVSIGKPTASVIASSDAKIGKITQECLDSENFKTYYIKDVAGVEICGAMKNIVAIAVGICDGASLGDNSKGSIMTLGLVEMNTLGKHFDAKRGTIYGLAGVGDLVTTCISTFSRNRFVGENLAKGKSMDTIKKEMRGMVAEGVSTTKAAYEYGRKHKINLPLTAEIYKIIFEKKEINTAIKDLMKLI